MHMKGKGMKTYVFRVVIKPDEDRWSASCPALRQYGATTWGHTQEEALQHIREVVQMVVEELLEDGEPIPEDVQISQEPLAAVTMSSMAIDEARGYGTLPYVTTSHHNPSRGLASENISVPGRARTGR
jgi:predicted RNase H-like HicB family nuclease